jgi:hypothetical protein
MDLLRDLAAREMEVGVFAPVVGIEPVRSC